MGGVELPDLPSCIDMEGVKKLYDMMGIFGVGVGSRNGPEVNRK